MKIYLEEKDMPKSCLECNNKNCEHQYIECYYEARNPNCPLQSLNDIYKQAQKEGAKKTAEYVNDLYKDFEPLDEFELNFILEKIDNGDL